MKKPIITKPKKAYLQRIQTLYWFGVRKLCLRLLRLAQDNAKAELLDSKEYSHLECCEGI
ncbi:MAG: hypothetical protein AMJ88_15655 [Anaerolineae bacterium SM23_ 63]|nr:MAG: hypothetical protein AMJ88_15655 [Anaerolineae bacterium SM23_ 63]